MLDAAKENLTMNFTPEQREAINALLVPIVDNCLKCINSASVAVKAMDQRPKKTHSEAEPDVFMPYVSQGMLEDLIAMLQVHV